MIKNTMRILLAALLATAACGGTSAPRQPRPFPTTGDMTIAAADAGNASDLATTDDLAPAINITSSSARQVQSAGSGVEVVVSLTLTNQSTMALSLAFPLFGVTTTQGLQYGGISDTANYPDHCDSAASLAPGHSVQCVVVFAPPATALVNQLIYTLPTGGMVTAPLTEITCSLCDGKCFDLSTDPANCGACGNVVGDGTCKGGKAVCSSKATVCSNHCVPQDANNCGSCGVACATANGYSCLLDGGAQGVCAKSANSNMQVSCNSLCGSHACYGGTANYHGACDVSQGLYCADVPPGSEPCSSGGNASFQYVGCWCLQ
jgi:hypothetical protein